MTSTRIALIFGLVYLAAGLYGLIPGALGPPPADAPPLAYTRLHGVVLGLFTVNLLHSLVHLAIGAWGLFAASARSRAVLYLRSIAVFYGVLAVMGLVPALNTVFGYIPIHGHDVWLHAGTAAIAAYFGFGPPGREPRRAT